eukprot:scaffold76250_cov27-Tisochrysis_lutea.AAC.6
MAPSDRHSPQSRRARTLCPPQTRSGRPRVHHPRRARGRDVNHCRFAELDDGAPKWEEGMAVPRR